MSAELARLVDAFAGLDVAVIGDGMLDSYLHGTAERLSREAPAPIVSLEGSVDVPGGAANTAVNVRSLGASVRFLTVVGEDPDGALLRKELEAADVATEDVVVDPSRRTLAKRRIAAGGQLLLRFDQGTTGQIVGDAEDELIERVRSIAARRDAVVVSDYGYGTLTPGVLDAVAELRREGSVLVVDAKDPKRHRRARPTAVKPNYREAVRLLGEQEVRGPDARAEQLADRGEPLLELTGAEAVVVTLDTEGALLFERDRPPYRTFARHTKLARPAGAGDTFAATLALALGAGATTTAAVELASAASAVVIEKDGTSTCTALELREHFAAQEKHLADRERLEARLEFHRRQGDRIVFTNGCFDILHRGHVAYLNRAKSQGDVLVVGLNSDESVRRLKGPDRPINTLEDRVEVMSALSCIDYIVPFADDTPHEVIRGVRPDVFVKGGDYTRESLPEAPLVEELGGIVRLLPYVEDRSTTGIIQRIRSSENQREA